MKETTTNDVTMNDNTTGVTRTDARTTAARRRVLLVGGVVPIAIAAAATVVMVSWIPELPDPIAVHWSGSGPDGFGPVLPMVFMPLGIVLAYSVFAVVAAWKPTAAGLLTGSQKTLIASSVWMSALLSIGIGGSVAIQRGLEDASEAGDIGLFVLGGAAGGLVLAAAAWFLLPATDRNAHAGVDPEPLELHSTEKVSWSRTVRLATAAVVVALVALAASIVAVVVTVTQAPKGAGFAIATLVVLAALLLGTGYWRASADRRGLIVRSTFGWPRVTVPLDDIRSVHVVEVNPSADFGGWGWRSDASGRYGVILRRGPAIQVTRSSGKKFVVTVDDAETGAAVLAALLPEQP